METKDKKKKDPTIERRNRKFVGGGDEKGRGERDDDGDDGDDADDETIISFLLQQAFRRPKKTPGCW